MTDLDLDPVFQLLGKMVDRINTLRSDVNEMNLRESQGLFTVQALASAVYPMNDNDTTIFMDTSGGIGTVNLQTAVGQGGRIVIIKDDAGNALANNITVNAFGGENIDGVASQVLNTNWACMGLQSNNSNWRILFRY